MFYGVQPGATTVVAGGASDSHLQRRRGRCSTKPYLPVELHAPPGTTMHCYLLPLKPIRRFVPDDGKTGIVTCRFVPAPEKCGNMHPVWRNCIHLFHLPAGSMVRMTGIRRKRFHRFRKGDGKILYCPAGLCTATKTFFQCSARSGNVIRFFFQCSPRSGSVTGESVQCSARFGGVDRNFFRCSTGSGRVTGTSLQHSTRLRRVTVLFFRHADDSGRTLHKSLHSLHRLNRDVFRTRNIVSRLGGLPLIK